MPRTRYPLPGLHHGLFALFSITGLQARSQTVVINEVSNGPAGNQEYVELVVVPDGPLDPCVPAPCLDLRGWIFDDNNGYHGSGGAAPGAMRFGQSALWSCVPLGTIILIYNDGDTNPAITGQDVDLNDGNCRIIVGANNGGYFEFTPITPNAALCSDPGGWGTDGSPSWLNNLAFANTGDCARICSPDGCEVFSFCYGGLSANATVYSAGNGGQRAWIFNSGDPYSASNWSYANVNSGIQTPGAPNNAANAAWIAQYNNGCTPLTLEPLEVTAVSTDACGCTGTATATATGSTPDYAFAWYDEFWVLLGQSTATASDLCGGIHHVIATSATGCADTATVTIVAVPEPNAGTDGTISLCPGDGLLDLFTALNDSPELTGTWSPNTDLGDGLFDPTVDAAGIYTYTVSGQAPCADASATVTVEIPPVIDATATATPSTCAGSDDGTIQIEPGDLDVYTWTDGPSGPLRSGLAPGIYVVDISSAGACPTSLEVEITEPLPITITTNTDHPLCGQSDGVACAVASGGTGTLTLVWDAGVAAPEGCAEQLAPGIYTVTVTDENNCTAQTTAEILNLPGSYTADASATDVTCWNLSDGSVALVLDPPSTAPVTWTPATGESFEGASVGNLPADTYTYAVTDEEQCQHTGTVTVGTPEPLDATIGSTGESCSEACDGTITLAVDGGTLPYTFTANSNSYSALPITGQCAGPVAVTITDAQGCELVLNTVIAPGIPVPPAAIGPLPVLCNNGAPVELSATPPGGVWSGNGIIDAATGLFDPTVAETGNNVITYTTTVGCPSNDQGLLLVSAVPDASFTWTGGSNGAPWTFNALDAHAASHSWWLDGEWQADGPYWILRIADVLPHTVCLIATEVGACSDTSCTLVQLIRDPEVHVPNAFTPDGDGTNDLFMPTFSGTVPQDALFNIHDRWGHVLYSNHPLSPWDGKSDGTEVPVGVYTWSLEFRAPESGEDHRLVGHVVLLR
ncbi:MAG TPA: gliding motility-associated C-terminal domain-containing protein [Flavobacteriales bacterium]